MTLEKKIKEILPKATLTVKKAGNGAEDNADEVTAHVGEVNATELKSLLRFGLKKIKRSGSGLTLKFNN